MIKGLGIDISQISRVDELIKNHAGFIDKILTEEEKKELKNISAKRKSQYVAGRFSAKESYSKALGTGIGSSFNFQDISILNNENGKPFIKSQLDNSNIHISISHTDELVFTEVIIEVKQ